MLASVVIPAFDRLSVLELVLRYFKYQDFPFELFEVVVVDDGSSEDIGTALKPCSFPFAFSVIKQANRGRAAARNAGVECAAGDLIIFCDADRIPDPTFVSAHVAFHGKHSASAAVGIPWDCFLGVRELERAVAGSLHRIRRFSRKPAYYATMRRLIASDAPVSPIAWVGFLVGNSSVKRSHLERIGGFNEALSTWGIEHFELALRLMQGQVADVRYLEAAGANYHVPHVRSLRSLREGIEAGVAALEGQPTQPAAILLRRFLFGEISLQELEYRYSGQVSPQIASSEALFFRSLLS